MVMHEMSQKALQITMELNNKYHTHEEIIQLMSELTGHEIDDSFGMFPPFYTDCGRNIHIGKNVFINAGCKFQDQGGIYIGDGALIGHNAVLATINHMEDPALRGGMIFHSDSYRKERMAWSQCYSTSRCNDWRRSNYRSGSCCYKRCSCKYDCRWSSG